VKKNKKKRKVIVQDATENKESLEYVECTEKGKKESKGEKNIDDSDSF